MVFTWLLMIVDTETYSWERIETPVNQVDGVESKQYNIVGMQIQKGNLPRPTSTVSITAEYIRLILTYIAQVNGVATDNALAITILNNFMSDVIAGTQGFSYDNTISGLIATTIKDAIDEIDDNLDTHIADTENPHEVTKAQVGLGNADNTSDADKPISTASQNALDLKANITYVDSQDALDEKIVK